jgi:hypothetical protein
LRETLFDPACVGPARATHCLSSYGGAGARTIESH